MDSATFGRRVQRVRVARGLTQLALAKQAQVPQSVLSALEAGHREGVTLEVAWRLARTLSVSLDYLIGLWETPEELASPTEEVPSAARARVLARGRGRPRKPPGTAQRDSAPSA